MLGRVRTFTVEASTRAGILKQLSSWLRMHTIGPWSHWGIVSEVRCLLPAKEGVRMMFLDVPGAGNQRANPFRQGILTQSLIHAEGIAAADLAGYHHDWQVSCARW